MNATVPTEPLLDIPPIDEYSEPPEPLSKRLLKPQTLVSFGLAIAIVAFLVYRMDINLGAVWTNIKAADVKLFALAVVVYYLTFIARTLRWRYMLGQAGINEANGYNVPGNWELFQILMLSWFANCIVPAKLGDGYRCYLLKQDCGAPGSTSLGTILAERLVDLSVLFVTMTITGFVAFHGNLPAKVEHTVYIGGGLMGVAVLMIVGLFFAREHIVKMIPDRFTRQFHDFHDAVFACLGRPTVAVLISLSIWMADGFRMWLVARALGADLGIELTLFVALMAALLTTIPFTPAGLGVVEAAVVVVLKLVDVDADMAGSIAVLDRVIGYWSLILVGLILYAIRMRRDLRPVVRG